MKLFCFYSSSWKYKIKFDCILHQVYCCMIIDCVANMDMRRSVFQGVPKIRLVPILKIRVGIFNKL